MARIFVREPNGSVVGTRTIENNDESCDPLLASTALAIALSIDPDAVLKAAASPPPVPAKPPAPPPQTPPPPPPPPPPPRLLPPPAAPVAPAPPRDDVALAARFVLGLGLLPKASAGFALGVDGALSPRFRWSAGVFVLPETRVEDGTFAFGLSAASLAGCVLPLTYSHFEAALCGGAKAGVIHAVVYTLQPTTPGDRLWVAADVSLELRFPVESWVFEVTADAIAPITRYRFQIESRPADEWVFREALPSALFGIGIGRRFQ